MNVKFFLCDNCASTIEIGDTGAFTHLAPVYCPLCGTPTLRRVKSFADWQTAACIVERKADPRLVTLLYQEWRKDANGFTTFIDYLKDILG